MKFWMSSSNYNYQGCTASYDQDTITQLFNYLRNLEAGFAMIEQNLLEDLVVDIPSLFRLNQSRKKPKILPCMRFQVLLFNLWINQPLLLFNLPSIQSMFETSHQLKTWLIHFLIKPLLRLLLLFTADPYVLSSYQDPIPNLALFSYEHQEEVKNLNIS